MSDQVVLEARRKNFRVAGNPIRTLEDAREFVNEVGLALVYPLRHSLHAPLATFIGAFVGAETGLPYQQIAFADPRVGEATGLMVRLLREKSAYEVVFHEDSALLVSAEVFPYYYALVGEKTPKSPPKLTGAHKVSRLSLDIYKAIEKHGALTKSELRERHMERGASISDAGMDRALHELWSVMKIMRVDYSAREGSRWDLLARWAAEPLARGARLSSPEALSAVISRYLQGVVAAEEKDVLEVVGQFAPRSRAAETIRALVAARELTVSTHENASLLQVAPQPPSKNPMPAVEQPQRARRRRNG